MKRQHKIILIIIVVILSILTTLSFLPFFSSHPFGGCKDTPEERFVDGPVICQHSANFWQYIRDDLRSLDR